MIDKLPVKGSPPEIYGQSQPEIEVLSDDRRVVVGSATRTGLTRVDDVCNRPVYKLRTYWPASDPNRPDKMARFYVLLHGYLVPLRD